MRAFRDKIGRDWSVEVNVAAMRRVRGLVGVDLMEIVEGTLIERLIRDPCLLCDVLYAVCRPQAEAAGISDEDFGAAMAGDAIEDGTNAMLEELVDFCPSPRDRRNLGRVLEATRQVMDRARDLVEQRINDGQLERIVEQALASAGGCSGDAPGSPASTPDR